MKVITPTKGVMMRQRLIQLFGEAGQWASLVDISELLAPYSSKLCNSAQTEYKSQKHFNISLTNLSLPRQCADTSGELV